MIFERRKQEVQNFLGKKGKYYAIHYATPEEKKYFEGILYSRGLPLPFLLNYPLFNF